MEQGWIKLHRKIVEKGYYRNSKYVHLWVHLLLLANHKSKEFMWNNQIILVKEGQLITGRDSLALATGISQSSIERILNMLEIEHQIEQQKTTKYRLITIVNWKEHQNMNSKVDNKRTTNGQQTDTNKNVKKDKNKLATTSVAPFIFKDYLKELENHSARHINVIGHFFEEKGIMFDTREKANTAVKRHLRPAREVSKFSDNEIVNATNEAKKQYKELYTVETILKILTR